MLSDAEELKKIKDISQRFSGQWKSEEIASLDDDKMLQFHKKMKSLAERLLKDDVNLDEENLVFALSGEPGIGGAYCHSYGDDEDGFIFFTADLLKFFDNEDQLAFVMAHELEHFLLQKKYGRHANDKMEETAADIRAIDKMVRAKMNLEEASKFALKLFSTSNVNLRDVMDEHLSGANRVTFIQARVNAEKDRLRRAELADPEIIGSITHPMDEEVMDLALNLPHEKSLRDFFNSKKYQMASVQKKIDMWFNKLEQELVIREKRYDNGHRKKNVKGCSLPRLSQKILKENYAYLRSQMGKVGIDHFAYRALMTCYKEENSELMLDKALILKELMNGFDTEVYNADAVGRDLGEVFKGFREAKGETVEKMLTKLSVLEILLRYEYRQKVLAGRILELNHDKKDIGKEFSKEIFWNEKLSVRHYFKMTELPSREMVILDGNCAMLIDVDGKLQEIDKDGMRFKEKFIARQINKVVEKLQNMQKGMPDDAESKMKTLMKAWQMILPLRENVKQQNELVLLENQLKNSGFVTIEGLENKESCPLLMRRLEQYLSDDAKAFFSEKFLYPNEENLPYTKYIREELLKSLEGLKDIEYKYHLKEPVKNFLDSISIEKYEDESPANMSFEIPYDRQIPFILAALKGFPDAVPHNAFERVTDTLLEQHLKAGKSLDDFEFLTSLEKAPIEIKESCMMYELLKKEPNIDLSLISELTANNYWSFLIHGMPGENIKDEKVKEILKARIKENIDKPENWQDDKNWGAGSEDFWVFKNKVDNMSFAHKFCIAMEKAQNYPESVEMFQDVALRFYQEGSVTEKQFYLAKALGYTQPMGSDVLKRTAFNEKCAKIFDKDFLNPDISVQDKVALFRALYKNKLFDEHYQIYFNVLIGKDGKKGLLKEIEEADISASERTNIYMGMLDKSYRIPDPDIRAEVVKRAAHSWWVEHGCYDDTATTPEKQDEFILKAQKLGEGLDIPIPENEALRCEIAELTLAQEDLSFELKPFNIEIDTQNKKGVLAVYGLDSIAYMLSEGIIRRDTVSSFLLGGDQAADIRKARMELLGDLNDAYMKNKPHLWYWYHEVMGHYGNDEDAYELARGVIKDNYLIVAKKEFDAAPLEAKALILQMISGSNDWERNFEQVADKLFDGAGDLGKVGKAFLKSYISSRDESERCLYLAAIYAAANSNEKSALAENSPYTSEQRALARGLRLFLENSDTPGIKLAQAISSYPEAPAYIRDEMQFSKTQANPPARWTVFGWLNQQYEADKEDHPALNNGMIKDIKLKEEARDDLILHGKLGKRKGSASSFVTYEFISRDGEKQIAKIKRNGMEEMSAAEFRVYRQMLKEMSKKFPWARSLGFLVDNAASMVAVEGNLTIGEQQLRDAQKLYPETAQGDDVVFKVNVMDWVARGKIWAIMKEAQGVDFKDLEQPYKKAAAKAVFTMELANMLSGKRFDADRHAGQYKFDTKTNTIGVFDTGSISVVEPTEKEKKVLGIVLANTVKTLISDDNEQLSDVLCTEIDRGITTFYEKEIKEGKPIPPYLSEFQRGLLALTDFHKEIPAKELGVCLMQALNNGKHQLDKDIYKGFTQQMFEPATGKKEALKGSLKAAAQLAKSDKAEMLPEAKAARKIGQIMAEKIIEYGDIYQGITQIPNKLKRAEILDILGSSGGKIQFGKGMLHAVFDAINPMHYDILERQQMGALLYHTVKEIDRAKKQKREVGLTEAFTAAFGHKHLSGEYSARLEKVIRLADSLQLRFATNSFKKAVILGRMMNKDVQMGYLQALRGDKDTGAIKRALSYMYPLQLLSEKSTRRIMKYLVKSLAPHCLKALNAVQKIKTKKQARTLIKTHEQKQTA